MISKPEMRSYLTSEPKFDDMMCSLHAVSKQPKGIIDEVKKVVSLARKFNEEIVKPDLQTVNETLEKDPTYVPWEWVEKANEWGFYEMWFPKLFGGRGYCFPSLSCFLEEISSVCLGLGNLIGVHYLGVSALMATWNVPLIDKICQEIIQSRKNQRPCLISFAMTEPGSGTDTAEVDLLKHANISCRAQKVEGGYVLNGTKIFISNGPISTWHLVVTFSDTDQPAGSGVFLALKTGMKGFSIGKSEKKMGQKACPASELVFKDCFVPDDQVCIDSSQMKQLSRNNENTYQQILDFITTASRPSVCAFGTGVARGAYEIALNYATETKVEGKLLANHEWAQTIFAGMYKNIVISRMCYLESNFANGLYGFFKVLQAKPTYYFMKWMPTSFTRLMVAQLFKTRLATKIFRKMQLDGYTDEEMSRIVRWASLAKFTGSDAGFQNCQLALELMGQAGIRHDRRAEKLLRDSKLLQIYEGTNQMNRVVLFKSLCQVPYPAVTAFSK